MAHGAWDLASDGTFLYIASRHNGIQVVRKSDIAGGAISACSVNNGPMYFNAIYKDGFLFTTDLLGNLFMIHKITGTAPDNCVVGAPNPSEDGLTISLNGDRAYALTVVDNKAYVFSTSTGGGIHIIDYDLSGGSASASVSETVHLSGNFYNIEKNDDALVLANGGPLRIMDLSNNQIINYSDSGAFPSNQVAKLIGRIAYSFRYGVGYREVDISNPQMPTTIGSGIVGAHSLAQSGNFLVNNNLEQAEVINVGFEIEGNVSGIESGFSFDLHNNNSTGGPSVTINANGAYSGPELIADGNAFDYHITNVTGAKQCTFDATGTTTFTGSMDFTAPATSDITCSGQPTLPDTGLSSCYAAEGTSTIACNGGGLDGQDGFYADTANAFSMSLTDGGLTATEASSGLIWTVCSKGQSGATCTGTIEEVNWADAVDYCDNLTTAGRSWRLPNINELISFADYDHFSPHVDTGMFPNHPGAGVHAKYWATTANESAPNRYMTFNHYVGVIEAETDTTVTSRYVRCVSGDEWDVPEHVDNGDGTVTDNTFGLLWTQCSMAAGGALMDHTASCAGTPTQYTWQDAINACENLDFAGRTDWRLPNVKEGFTIMDYTQTSAPAINLTAFPNTPSTNAQYWSSTNIGGFLAGSAWHYDISAARNNNSSKSTTVADDYVRCVTDSP